MTAVANTPMQTGVPLSDSTILYNPNAGSMGGAQGGYDGGGINPVIGPNGERLLDMKDAGTGPFEGLPPPANTGTVGMTDNMGEVGMADPTPDLSNNPPAEAAPAMPESALSQLDPIPEDMPNTGLLGYEELTYEIID